MFYDRKTPQDGAGRHRGGHGHGRDLHGRGGRHGLHSARKLSSADLQLVLMALLEKKPSHGYELIKSLEEISDGFYVPSPGMIYPALTYLEEIEYADVEAEGSKKKYSLTSAGRDYLTQNLAAARQILDELAQIGTRMEDARRAFAGERGRDEDLGNHSERLRGIRNELRSFLRGFQPPTGEEDSRIADILHAAIAQIRGEHVRRDPQTTTVDPEMLLAAIAQRRSMGLSRMKPDPVDRKIIEKMLEAANWAPSHEDTEPWRFRVFAGEGRETLAKIFATGQKEGQVDHDGARKRAFAAPVWISIGMSPGLQEDGSMLMSEEEEIMAVACAVQNLHLMSSAFGLAGMWHSKGVSVHPAVARELGLEPPARLLGFFMCGWPNTEPPAGERRPLAEKVSWDWGEDA